LLYTVRTKCAPVPEARKKKECFTTWGDGWVNKVVAERGSDGAYKKKGSLETKERRFEMTRTTSTRGCNW